MPVKNKEYYINKLVTFFEKNTFDYFLSILKQVTNTSNLKVDYKQILLNLNDKELNNLYGLVKDNLEESPNGAAAGPIVVASDQYLAIVIPGKMFKDAFEEKGLSAENLSRTLEDSGTVTSALIPWNTCGAYHYGVLGVSVTDYFIYAIFNWLSPVTTLFYAAFMIKIKTLSSHKK